MNQYLDEKDGKWHITMSIDMPRVLVKNKLNFRLYSVTTKDGNIVRDPQLKLSKYIFPIHQSLMGRTVFFSSYFDISEIESIVEFKFGLCDERIRWYENTIISINNDYIGSEKTKVEEMLDNSESEKIAIISQEESSINNLEFNPHEEIVVDGISSPKSIELAVESTLVEASKKASTKKVGRKKK